MPRTMTAKRLAEIRDRISIYPENPPYLVAVLAELDAEVAAHQETAKERGVAQWAATNLKRDLESMTAMRDAFKAACDEKLDRLDAEVAAHQETKQLLADDDGISSSLEMQLIKEQAVSKALVEALEAFREQIKTVDASGPGFPFRVGGSRADWNRLRAALDLYAAQKIKGIFNNIGWNTYVINPGDAIFQMLIQKVETAELVEVEELSASERGAKGFGSTDATQKEGK